MEIKIKFSKNVYSICFGYSTPWFSQMKFLTVTKEYYNNMQVDFAVMVFQSWF